VVGLVVGPKGATIKRIQQDTHTYIITPSREREPIFEVTGLPENVEAARKEIETHIANRTGVYPSTTIGTPQSLLFDEENRQTSDFHLNGVDTTLTNSATGTPDSTPANGGGSLFSIDTRRDSANSILSGPPDSLSTTNGGSLFSMDLRRDSANSILSAQSESTPNNGHQGLGGGNMFSIDMRRDSTNSTCQPRSAPSCFSSSLSTGFNPFLSIADCTNFNAFYDFDF